jgi:protein-arginine kinase activator protein McsA
MNTDWRAKAACRGADTNVWFPEQGHSDGTAQRICAGCPVRTECLDDALRFPSDGIRGGLRARERDALRRGQGAVMVCEGCGVSFVAFSARRRFCSRECRRSANRARNVVAHRIGTSEYKRARAQRTT